MKNVYRYIGYIYCGMFVLVNLMVLMRASIPYLGWLTILCGTLLFALHTLFYVTKEVVVEKYQIVGAAIVFQMIVIVAMLLADVEGYHYTSYSKQIYMMHVPIALGFYALGRQGLLNYSYISRFALVLVLVGLYRVIKLKATYGNITVLGELDESGFVGYVDMRNIIPYYLMWCAPLLFFFRNKLLRFGGLTVLLIAFLISAKRGPIFILSVSFLMSFIVVPSRINKKMIFGLFGGIVCLMALPFVFPEQISFFVSRFDFSSADTLTANRTLIWLSVVDDIRKGELLLNLFGRGFEATKGLNFDNFGRAYSAHNDYLDIFYNYGIIGIVSYFIMIGFMFRFAIRMVKERCYGGHIVLVIVLSYMFSPVLTGLYYSQHTMIYFSFLFFAYGNYYREIESARFYNDY